MSARGRVAGLAAAAAAAMACVGAEFAAQAADGDSTMTEQPTVAATPAPGQARSDYIEYCAGCHGIQGSSRPANVPVLRDRIGYFLCLPQGREYLIRLPNVASAAVEDDAALMALMNYVVAEFAGTSKVPGGKPYTVAEVSAWRRKPLTATSLIRFRSEVVGKMRRQCRNVPATLEKFS